MVTQDKKTKIMEEFSVHKNDTGSLELQIALLTARIEDLNEHFIRHPKDNASKTGLMKLVGRRRSFLNYLIKHDNSKYENIVSRLHLRK